MRQRSPRTPDMTPPPTQQVDRIPECVDRMDDAVTRYHRDTESRSGKFIRWATVSTLGAVAAGAVWLGGDVVKGVQEGKESVQASHAQIHDIAPLDPELSPIYQQHATFVLTGLGTKDPSHTAEALTVHQEVGRVYGVEYGNKDLNIKDMATRVIEQAREAHVRDISLDGYSAGGLVGLAIGAYISKHAPDLHVVSVVLNSSPVGEHSLSERSERGIALMNHILELNEDFKYYERGRIAVEVLNRSDRYLKVIGSTDAQAFLPQSLHTFSYDGVVYELDYEKLRHELTSVEEKMQNKDAASTSLIDAQAQFIIENNYVEYLQDLPENTLVVYTGSRDVAHDSIVNIEPSIADLTRSLERYHPRYKILRPDVGHANPTERLAEYTSTIRNDIHPALTQLLTLEFLYRLMAGDAETARLHSTSLAGAKPHN